MSKEEAFQQLQEVLVKNYFSNLELLKCIDEPLYTKVELLSQAINDGTYKERYELEFIEKDGEFDIYDNSNDKYLYNKEPSKNIKKALNSIQFDKKGYFSILEEYFFEDKKNIKDVDRNNLQESIDADELLLKDIKKYKNILKDDTSAKKKNYKRIDKFFFIGALTGRELLSISKKVKATNYFVHEPNLELFRLSLFAFDYTMLLSNDATVQFSVMDDPIDFEDKVYQFLVINNWANHTIKYYTTNFNTKESFTHILNALITYKPTSFNYNMLLFNVFKNLSQRINKYKMLSFPLSSGINTFDEKPVLYVCAGPSLNENINWLKENHNNFFIVTIGAAYKQLLEIDIKPEVIISIDPKYEDINRLQFDEDSCKKIQDSIVLASVNTDQRILDRFNQNKLFLFDVLYTLKENKIPLEGFSVGEIGYRILIELGVQNLYLLGTDLAINQKTGSTHSVNSSSGELRNFDLNEEIKEVSLKGGNISLRNDLIKVKGNFQNTVYTNRNFNNSIYYYNKIGNELKKNEQKVYNLCNHGAYFENTIPLKVEELLFNKIATPDINFISLLENVSTKELSDEEKKNINLQKQDIQSLLSYIDTFISKEYNSYSLFKKDTNILYERIMGLSSVTKTLLPDILLNYMSIINPYVDYCFNDTKIKKEAKKIKEISSLWLKEIKYHSEKYLNYLEEIK